MIETSIKTPTAKQQARSIAQELMAVEVLEYHDKNWLHHGTRPDQLSRNKQDRFRNLLDAIDNIPELDV